MSTLAASAGSGVLHAVKGKTLEVRPLTLKDYGTLELCALKDHKKKRVESYAQVLEHISPEDRKSFLNKLAEDNAKIDESDLPPKIMMIDKDGNVTIDETECVKRQKVPFVQWWMSFTHEGRLTAVWLSVRKAQPDLSKEDVERLVMDDPSALEELANVVGDVSAPKLGNSPEPAQTK
jgi:hypothetical protein